MGIEFYYDSWSPPCRTVALTARILDVPLKPIKTTPGQGDTQRPEFKQVRGGYRAISAGRTGRSIDRSTAWTARNEKSENKKPLPEITCPRVKTVPPSSRRVPPPRVEADGGHVVA